MSIDRVVKHLKKYGMDNRIMKFSSSSATVELAAKEIGCRSCDIAKTMSFIVNDKPIVIVVSGDMKIDNSKYKKEFKTKARMIPSDLVEEFTGHEVGGVCPFGLNDDVRIYFDISLKNFDYVYPACGSHNSAIKISIEELEKVCNNEKWVDVCKKI